MKKASDIERQHCLSRIRKYNKSARDKGLNDLIICENRAEFGYQALNDIVYQVCNIIGQGSLKPDFNRFIFEPVMDWQNGFLKF